MKKELEVRGIQMIENLEGSHLTWTKYKSVAQDYWLRCGGCGGGADGGVGGGGVGEVGGGRGGGGGNGEEGGIGDSDGSVEVCICYCDVFSTFVCHCCGCGCVLLCCKHTVLIFI